MNYKIGDKVNISLTAPLIVTDLAKHPDRIEISSEDGDICFWASSKFFTPNTPDLTIDFILPQLCDRTLVELHTQKLLINGQPARKILDIKNALPRALLPPDYINSPHHYYQYEDGNGHFEFDGNITNWLLTHDDAITKDLHISPAPAINLRPYGFVFNQNSIWSEPDYQIILASLRACSPHTPPPTSPHKSLNIGDLIITKPTAKSEYDLPIGDRLGIIEEHSQVSKDCYIVRWVRHLCTFQTFHYAYSIVHPSQFI